MYQDITVLIVEDDQPFCAVVDQKLSAKHFRTVCANGIGKALEHIEKVDVLLVDLGLPNGDGRVLIDRWYKLPGSGPICIMSGGLNRAESTDMLDRVWNVFEKPFRVDTLVDAVERYASVVRGRRCCKEVGKLKKRINILYIVVAALGGTQIFLPLIEKAIAGITL